MCKSSETNISGLGPFKIKYKGKTHLFSVYIINSRILQQCSVSTDFRGHCVSWEGGGAGRRKSLPYFSSLFPSAKAVGEGRFTCEIFLPCSPFSPLMYLPHQISILTILTINMYVTSKPKSVIIAAMPILYIHFSAKSSFSPSQPFTTLPQQTHQSHHPNHLQPFLSKFINLTISTIYNPSPAN